MSLKKCALTYRDKYGFSVIPIRLDKKPLIKWEKYQQTLPTEKEIEHWWRRWPGANRGIVTGKLSGIAVIFAFLMVAFTKNLLAPSSLNTGSEGMPLK